MFRICFAFLICLCFSDIVRLSNLLFVFDSLSHNLPNSISNFFSINRGFHPYFTRNVKNSKLILPTFKSVKYGKNSIKYQCITEWNKSLQSILDDFNTKYKYNHHYESYPNLNRNQVSNIVRKVVFI